MASPTFTLPARDFSSASSALGHAASVLRVVGLALDHYQNNPLPDVRLIDMIGVLAELVDDSAVLVEAVAEGVGDE